MIASLERSLIRRLAAGSIVVALGLLVTAADARAALTYQSSIGSSGSGAGTLSGPAGVAVNDTTGDIYVVDRNQNRIEQFTGAGAFVRMWGYDVVAGGEDNKSFADEVSEVRIRADSGSFALTFGGSTTAPIAFDATAGEVEAALNALPTVSSGGGSVTVAGGPGNVAGSSPYVVTFDGGPLAGANLDLGIETSGLGVPAGTAFSCEGAASEADSIAYQWLAGGTPIPGATASTFTPGAAEQGETVQCRVIASLGVAKTVAASRPYSIAGPAPTPLPPLGPQNLAAPTGEPVVESIGGQTLTCSAGTWTRNPETFTYQWYRDGVPIGPSTTTTETTNQHVTTQNELLSRGVYQCAVTGVNTGGASVVFSGFLATEPEPEDPEAANPLVEVTSSPSGASKVIVRTNGGPVFEVCRPKPPSNDTCKAGVAGDGAGQLDAPRSIAVDDSPGGGGAVYVMDDDSPRVQKFSAEGEPILIFGGRVNQTTDSDVCTIASGDACGPGIRARDLSPGAFGFIPPVFGLFSELGNLLAVDNAGNVYVGDPRFGQGDERVQKFDAGGTFLAQAKIPAVFGNTGFQIPISIAVDSAQRLYVATVGDAVVERIFPSEFTADGNDTVRAGNLIYEDGEPVQLAIDPNTDSLLISDRNNSSATSTCGGAPGGGTAIVEFDPEGNRIDCTIPSGLGSLPTVTGLAVSPSGLLYASVPAQNTIKAFKLPKPKAPTVSGQSVTDITTETAVVHGLVNPGFENTTFVVQYGFEPCSIGGCQEATGSVLRGLKVVEGTARLTGLEPNTTYRYRIIVENGTGKATSAERTFTTFPLVDLVNDPCPNALARKQTKTVGLLDCRAYELASASFAGGYDVESNLVPGRTPFDGYRQAEDRLLYGVSDGGIPGAGDPTNRGLDPYVAVRGADGWTTSYAGIPANNPFATEPFSSTLAGAAADLATLAFAGPDICAPCFADGSSGIPVRLPGGALVQGMAGSIANPGADPVEEMLSADGSHLVFGTTSKLEPAGNEGTASIYNRDLNGGTTQVVSAMPDGTTMTGDFAALDVSSNGSRVVVGTAVSTDGAGNTYRHPYIHLGSSSATVDLAPATSAGSLFAGMTADGGRVFLVTTDQLTLEDTDSSADLYASEVDGSGPASLKLLSAGVTPPVGNSNACDPAPNSGANNWNAVGPASANSCGVVAFAGGAGIARGDGSAYFLSPEKLDGKGTANQPNLFVVRPGSAPYFIATLEPGNQALRNAVNDSEIPRFEDFQVSDNGRFAMFATTRPLKLGYNNGGRVEVYGYDAEASEEVEEGEEPVIGILSCVSCSPTEAIPQSDASLPPNGSGITEDGRFFFNTAEQLTLRDTNEKLDAYEWSAGNVQLISTGTSAHPSGLLGVSADGVDAFFFTRDELVPSDHNGQAMKIYDARQGGGFFVIPPPPPCAASDECHGPGTQAAPAPPIGSFRGVGGQHVEHRKCRKGFVKRRGRCVRKKNRKRNHEATSKRGNR